MANDYKFVLKEDFTYDLPNFPPEFCLENKWIKIENAKMTVRKGYAWDGCTPSTVWFDSWEGELCPDGKYQTQDASGFHDPWYQFIISIQKAWGVSMSKVRKYGDDMFAKLCNDRNFKYTNLYYQFVRKVGWALVLKRKWFGDSEAAIIASLLALFLLLGSTSCASFAVAQNSAQKRNVRAFNLRSADSGQGIMLEADLFSLANLSEQPGKQALAALLDAALGYFGYRLYNNAKDSGSETSNDNRTYSIETGNNSPVSIQ
jgi:hypothetical protein